MGTRNNTHNTIQQHTLLMLLLCVTYEPSYYTLCHYTDRIKCRWKLYGEESKRWKKTRYVTSKFSRGSDQRLEKRQYIYQAVFIKHLNVVGMLHIKIELDHSMSQASHAVHGPIVLCPILCQNDRSPIYHILISPSTCTCCALFQMITLLYRLKNHHEYSLHITQNGAHC